MKLTRLTSNTVSSRRALPDGERFSQAWKLDRDTSSASQIHGEEERPDRTVLRDAGEPHVFGHSREPLAFMASAFAEQAAAYFEIYR
jgi:hypothetical protein